MSRTKQLSTRKQVRIDGVVKQHSHYVWFLNTRHWPVDDEIIHHIDGDWRNDEFSNLALMTKLEHVHLHHLGNSHSNETRAKISEALSGEKNPNWKGDNAKPHAKYMREWYRRRKGGMST